MAHPRIDPAALRVAPLAERRHLLAIEQIAIDPAADPPPTDPPLTHQLDHLAEAIRTARRTGASVVLCYGAHLIKNGCALLAGTLIADGWVTHLATQGAGLIHDLEFAMTGRSSESVRDNAPVGRFGAWEETGRAILTAAMHGAANDLGFGEAVGRHILENDFAYQRYSLTACASRHSVPLCVMPGLGYDIYCCHPAFTEDAGAAIGRTATRDFHTFAHAMTSLSGGVYLSVGSAVMSPQVFEKAFSIANNLRHGAGQPFIAGHHLAVVDIQPAGQWDWSSDAEPPEDHPAYYLRWCKSFARLAATGTMDYLQADNRVVLHGLLRRLGRP